MAKQRTFRELPMRQLELGPNYRKSRDDDYICELAENLKRRGWLSALLVAQLAPDRFAVIVGSQRFLAAKLGGIETAPCFVSDGEPDELEVLADQLSENSLRRNPCPIENARGFDRLIKLSGLAAKTVAERFGWSAATVCRDVGLLRLPLEDQELIRVGEMSKAEGYLKVRKPRPSAPDRPKPLKIVVTDYTVAITARRGQVDPARAEEVLREAAKALRKNGTA